MAFRCGEGDRVSRLALAAGVLLVVFSAAPRAFARQGDVYLDAQGRVILDAEGRRINYEPDSSQGAAPVGFEAEDPPPSGPRAVARKAGLNVSVDWVWAVYGLGIGVTGLNVADLDGDGSLEIVAGGVAGGHFWYVMQHSAGTYPKVWTRFPQYASTIKSLRTYDLDGDGDDEVLVGVGSEIRVYDGLDPVEIRTIATGATEIRGLRVADVDGDTALELVFCDSGSLFVHDYATGLLEEEVGGLGSNDVAVGQVDADPGLEIVIGGLFASGGYVLDGATRAVEWTNVDGFGSLTRVGDLDGDGMDEIVAGNFSSIYVYDADTQSLAYTLPMFDLDAVQVIDVEGDGPPEIVYGDGQWGDIHVVDGATSVEKWSVPNPDSGTTDVAVGDVDGDGNPELLWGAGYSSSGADHLFVVDTVTRASEWQSDDLDGPFYGLDWGDVDDDGTPELLHTTLESGSGYDGGFFLVHDAVSKAEEYRSGELMPAPFAGIWRIARAQVDADPQEEIFVTSASGYTGWILAYDGVTYAEEWQASGSSGDPFRGLQVADVDGDTNPEVVAVGRYIFVFDAATGGLEWQSADLGYDHELLRVANVDGDSHLEILAARFGGGLVIYDGVTHIEQSSSLSGISALETADIDIDGVAEVFLGTTNGEIQRLDPATGLVAETIGDYGDRIDGLALGDLTLDNLEDFVFCSGGQVHVASGAGGALLYASPVYGTDVGSYDSLRLGDFDGDGKPEIITNLGILGVLVQEVEEASLNGPVVTIDSPADGAGFTTASIISFLGTATDVEDGDLSGSITWTSSIDGLLGTGPSIATSLSAGIHTITAEVTDASGLRDANAIVVTVGEPGPPLGSLTPGNILVSGWGWTRTIYEYTTDGTLVTSFRVPSNLNASGQYLRDLVRDETGRIHVVNGSSDPVLSSYDGLWSTRAFVGWDIGSSGTDGGIATKSGFVFVSDGQGIDAGIVRFDLDAGSPTVRFGIHNEYSDLTIGLDCKLYALRESAVSSQTVDVYDPISTAYLGSVALRTGVPSMDLRGIAVSATGEFFAADWGGDLHHFDATGGLVNSIDSGAYSLYDVNLDAGGRIISVGESSDVVVTTTALQSVTSFSTPASSAFVAWIGGEHRSTCEPCSDSLDLVAGAWKMISMPCDVTGADSVQDVFGDDLDPVDYGSRWGLFERDELGGVYSLLGLAEPLVGGEGYWIKTLDAGRTATVEGDLPSPIEVPLTADPVDGMQNLVGHPFDYDVCWADVQVVDGASVLSLDQADPRVGALRACEMVPPDPSCVMSRVAAKWDGAAYETFDGETANLQGTLVPFDGLWVEAFKPGIALRIPPMEGSGCTFCAPLPMADAGPDSTICQGNSVTLGTPALPGHAYSWSPGGETTAQITVSPVTTTTYTLTVTTVCGTAQDSVQVTVVAGGLAFSEDFEGDVSGWTATGLWHRTTSTGCFTPTQGYWSPVRAFYYGQDGVCTYDTGSSNSGTLTSPLISVDGSSELTFLYLRVAEQSSTYDRCDVQIVDGAVVTTLGSITANATAWTQIAPVSLAAWAGSSIRVRFFFNTVDSVLNAMPGWLIDDVSVSSSGGCLASLTTPAAKRPAAVPSKLSGDWQVRLVAESADLRDEHSLLGQLSDALDGADYHDLKELEPFGDRYLSIVFPQEDWGDLAGDYASDFHAPRPAGDGQWRFDVVAAGLTAPVTLSWSSLGISMDRMALVEVATGVKVPAAADGTYTFTMAGERSSFLWVSEMCTGDTASGDADFDGLCGNVDNCPIAANPLQRDGDADGAGDACDLCWGDDAAGDADGDQVCADLDCNDRDPAVRVGCTATDAIFADGFESGGLSTWSSAIGVP